jgi:predicted nucleic acid-binding protein
MSDLKVLLDTNVLIPAEDPRVVPAAIALVFDALNKAKAEILAHTASHDDLSRDKDAARREISLSKLRKYRLIPKPVLSPPELAAKYGPIQSPNDLADCQMLYAVDVGAADIFVTSDTDIFRRARAAGLDERVLSPRQLVDLLDEKYASSDFAFRYVADLSCSQLNFSDPIFASLRADYGPDFEQWTKKICKQERRCWVIADSNNAVAGLVIYKDEPASETDIPVPGKKILKLATFKVSEAHRGGRLGELLLRQALWFAYSNGFDSVYVTAFEKQRSLNDLLSYFGFRESGRNARGELVLVKSWLIDAEHEDAATTHALNYPKLDVGVNKFLIVPIRPEYYQRLFPEALRAARGRSGFLFTDSWSGEQSDQLAVSTSIRKVYVCNSRITDIQRGDVALFYFSKDDSLAYSQTLAVAGMIERFDRYKDASALIANTAKRTVYTPNELRSLAANDAGAAVITFVFSGYLTEPVSLEKLMEVKAFLGPPQSLMRLEGVYADRVKPFLRLSHLPGE